MALIVQKYGGTSLANIDRIKAIARRIQEYSIGGDQLVIVASARGGVTSELIEKAKALHKTPNSRELDMLLACGEQEAIALTAIALQALGIPAISMTGPQAGILTDTHHTKSSILQINTTTIQKHLDFGEVVIVAGFQGISTHEQITTLGRGGSDLTAIALAHALQADHCQIFTDVEGVYTADPFIVENAIKIPCLHYDAMLSLAQEGSKVMQTQAVAYAKKYNIPFEIRSSFNHQPGTIIKQSLETVLQGVCGIAIDKHHAQITLATTLNTITIIIQALQSRNITFNILQQDTQWDTSLYTTISVHEEELDLLQQITEDAIRLLSDGKIIDIQHAAKVSIIGNCTNENIRNIALDTLSKEQIPTKSIIYSDKKISLILDRSSVKKAANTLHTAFKLDKIGTHQSIVTVEN